MVDGGDSGGPPASAADPAVDTTGPTTSVDAGPDLSVPVVDPASVEAFCALEDQLDAAGDAQMSAVDVDNPDGFRLAMATFLTDNAAIIDQYTAAAPPEIEGDVRTTIEQLRSAVDDPARFEEAMTDNAASERVSDFIDVNCT